MVTTLAVREVIERYRDCFARGGFELHMIWDGVEEDIKQDLHKWRYERRIGEMRCVHVRTVAAARHSRRELAKKLARPDWLPSADAFSPPPNIGAKLRALCASLGIKCISAIGACVLAARMSVTGAGEADRFAAWYCDTIGAYGVLADDSDFFVLPVPRCLSVKTLDCRGPFPGVRRMHRAHIVQHFGFAGIEPFVPLAASLCGNDYVPAAALLELHTRLLGRKGPPHATIAAVFKLVAASTRAVISRFRAPPPVTRALLGQVLDEACRRAGLSPAAAQPLLPLVLDSCEQYDVTGAVSARGYPPGHLPLHPRFAALGAGTLLPSTMHRAFIAGHVLRGSVQVLMLGVDRVGRILDGSLLCGDVPATAIVMRPVRQASFGVLFATLVAEGSQPRRQRFDDELVHALLAAPAPATPALHPPPFPPAAVDVDRHRALAARFVLVCSSADAARVDYVEELVHSSVAEAVHATYTHDRATDQPISMQAARALRCDEGWAALLASLDLLTHGSMLLALGAGGAGELAVAACAAAFLLRGGHVTRDACAALLAHVLLLRVPGLARRLSALPEAHMPPLDMAAVDLGAVFQSTTDGILELHALLGRPLGPVDLPWRMYDGRVLHVVHALLLCHAAAPGPAAAHTLLARFDSDALQLGRMHGQLMEACAGAAQPMPATCTRAPLQPRAVEPSVLAALESLAAALATAVPLPLLAFRAPAPDARVVDSSKVVLVDEDGTRRAARPVRDEEA